MNKPEVAQIGFGTGNLYGGREHARSVNLVRAAIDDGIRWIDTAPLYGHGAAERIVGEAIAGRRDRLVLVSKVGILPSQLSTAYKLHARLASLAQKLPGGRAVLPSPSQRRPRFHVFAPAAVRATVERSLTLLRTDRLDWLLLHECDLSEATDPDLMDTLDRLVAQGKILGFGTATQRDSTVKIAAWPGATRFGLFQLPSADASDPLGALSATTGQGIVIHSLFATRLKPILARLASDERLRTAALNLSIDPDRPDLASRLLAHAARLRGIRAVLFSTSDRKRLYAMAGAMKFSAEEAAAGARLMAEAKDN
jgi:hypothetical protein